MLFKDVYALENTSEANKDKIVVSADAYAVGEMIEKLIEEVRKK